VPDKLARHDSRPSVRRPALACCDAAAAPVTASRAAGTAAGPGGRPATAASSSPISSSSSRMDPRSHRRCGLHRGVPASSILAYPEGCAPIAAAL